MQILSELKSYSKWNVVATGHFDESERNLIEHAEVVAPSAQAVAKGVTMPSVCFFLKDGGNRFIPVSPDSLMQVGDNVNVDKLEITRLHKDGEARDIFRCKEAE